MNHPNEGPERPRLWPPRALQTERPDEPAHPILARRELRRLVAAMVG